MQQALLSIILNHVNTFLLKFLTVIFHVISDVLIHIRVSEVHIILYIKKPSRLWGLDICQLKLREEERGKYKRLLISECIWGPNQCTLLHRSSIHVVVNIFALAKT
ncbi:hypothetical protein ACJX0J_025503 [Zea mays]